MDVVMTLLDASGLEELGAPPKRDLEVLQSLKERDLEVLKGLKERDVDIDGLLTLSVDENLGFAITILVEVTASLLALPEEPYAG